MSTFSESRAEDYILGSGSVGGTYYPVGKGLSALIGSFLHHKDIHLESIKTSGSQDNIDKLLAGQIQFAIMQALVCKRSTTQETYQEIRSVMALWPDVEHFIINSRFKKNGTIDDLLQMKQKRFSFGKKKSGSRISTSILLKNLGSDIEDYKLLEYAGYSLSGAALQHDEIDGFGVSANVPVRAIIDTYKRSGSDVLLLSFTNEQVEKANNGMNIWTPYTIKKGTYPGQNEDIQTIMEPNFLAVRADVSDEDVYELVKAVFRHKTFLYSIHKATEAISLETALKGLPVRLHPGAIKYFEEQGLEIPEHLQ